MTRGYHRSRPHPAAYALSLGCAAGMVAAIATSAPDIVAFVDPGIAIRNIPLPEDPPVIPERPQPRQPRAATVPTPSRPDVVIPVPGDPVDIDTTIGTFPVDVGVPDAGVPAGTGTEPVPADPPKPPPVMVAASIAPGVTMQPDYPASERRSGVEGNVTVRVLIGTDGRVTAVEAVGDPRPGLFEATRRHALARWRFRPATRDGAPYETWRQFTVRFVLENA